MLLDLHQVRLLINGVAGYDLPVEVYEIPLKKLINVLQTSHTAEVAFPVLFGKTIVLRLRGEFILDGIFRTGQEQEAQLVTNLITVFINYLAKLRIIPPDIFVAAGTFSPFLTLVLLIARMQRVKKASTTEDMSTCSNNGAA